MATPAQRLQPPAAKQGEFTSLLNDIRRSRGWLDFPELLTREHLSRLAIVPGLYPAEIESITYETAHIRGRTDISWVDMVYTSPVTGHPERVRCWVPQDFVATIEQYALKTMLCRLAIGAAGTMTPWPYDDGTFEEEPYYGEDVA